MSLEPSRIRVLTVDDHPLVRQGIAGLIGVQPGMTVVGEAENGRDELRMSARTAYTTPPRSSWWSRRLASKAKVS